MLTDLFNTELSGSHFDTIKYDTIDYWNIMVNTTEHNTKRRKLRMHKWDSTHHPYGWAMIRLWVFWRIMLRDRKCSAYSSTTTEIKRISDVGLPTITTSPLTDDLWLPILIISGKCYFVLTIENRVRPNDVSSARLIECKWKTSQYAWFNWLRSNHKV